MRHAVHGTEVAEGLAEALRRALGENLVRVSLFGSRARGDHRLRSDFDLLVVVRDAGGATRDAVHRLALALELERGVDLSTKILDLPRFEALRISGLPFWRRFGAEEKVLWPTSSPSG